MRYWVRHCVSFGSDGIGLDWTVHWFTLALEVYTQREELHCEASQGIHYIHGFSWTALTPN